MVYVKVENNQVAEYPYSVRSLRNDNPNTSFPKSMSDDMLANWGVYPVTVSDMPSYTARTQNVTQNDNPTLVNSVWTLDWTVSDKTADEITSYDASMAKGNRTLRDDKLKETDFYALSDVTMSSGMTTYRQALRDITSHANWPNLNDDDWPTKP